MEERKFCPDCQVGILKKEGSTYYTWIENELVIVPDFPCWVCDVCGHRDWDQSAVFQLGALLSPTAGTGTYDRFRPASKAESESPKRKHRRSGRV